MEDGTVVETVTGKVVWFMGNGPEQTYVYVSYPYEEKIYELGFDSRLSIDEAIFTWSGVEVDVQITDGDYNMAMIVLPDQIIMPARG